MSYSYNADEIMYSASLIKLPFALSLLWENEDHDRGFDGIFTYTGAEYAYGSGEIKFSPAGSTYTFLELMEYMLRVSDNVASPCSGINTVWSGILTSPAVSARTVCMQMTAGR